MLLPLDFSRLLFHQRYVPSHLISAQRQIPSNPLRLHKTLAHLFQLNRLRLLDHFGVCELCSFQLLHQHILCIGAPPAVLLIDGGM